MSRDKKFFWASIAGIAMYFLATVAMSVLFMSCARDFAKQTLCLEMPRSYRYASSCPAGEAARRAVQASGARMIAALVMAVIPAGLTGVEIGRLIRSQRDPELAE